MATSPPSGAARRLSLVVVALLAVAACGDDGGGGGEQAQVDEFCDQVRSLDDGGQTIDLDDPGGLTELEEFVEDAPSGVRDDLDYFVEQAKQLDELDEDDPEALNEAFGLFLDPQFIESIQGFGVFVRDECGIDVPGLDELESIDPGQIEEDLNDLEGQFDEFRDELEGGLEDFQDQLEGEFGEPGEPPPDTAAGG